MKPSSQRSPRTEQAQGMIEFALILPLLLVVMFGLIEGGRLLLTYSAVSTASREAARYGSAGGDIAAPGRYQDCNGIRSAARRVGGFAGIEDANINITYSLRSGSATCSDIATKTVIYGDRVDVQVSTMFKPLMPLVNLPAIPISSTSRRTILKDIDVNSVGALSGTGTPEVSFDRDYQAVREDISPEGSASGSVPVTLQLSTPTDKDVTVNLGISGSASEPDDYYFGSKTLVLPAGSGALTVDVYTYNDNIYEGPESIIVSLVSVTNATFDMDGFTTHTISIEDDETPPYVYFEKASDSQAEADCSQSKEIKAQMTWPAANPVIVPVILDGSTAVEGVDFTLSSNTFEFTPGSLSASLFVTVPCNDLDSLDEFDETVVLTLQPSSSAVLDASYGPLQHTLTIVDDDLPPSVSFTWPAQTVVEALGRAAVEVQLNTASGKEVQISFSLNHTFGNTIAVPQPLTFLPGVTKATFLIPFTDDGDAELLETIQVRMLNPINTVIGSPSTHTITVSKTASLPSVYFSLAFQSSPEANTRSLSAEVRVTSALSQDITIQFSEGGTAERGKDYSLTANSVVIPAGSASAVIPLTLYNDGVDEQDETIILTLIRADYAQVGADSIHTITIQDDDTAVASFSPPEQSTAEDGDAVTLYVNLNTISSQDISVRFNLGGTATEGIDYTITASPVVITAGTSSAEITITPINDRLIENDEIVVVSMEQPANAQMGAPNVFTLTIDDDDALICPDATAPVIDEDTFYFTLNNRNLQADQVWVTGIRLTWTSKENLREVRFGQANVSEVVLWSGTEVDGFFDLVWNDLVPDRAISPNSSKRMSFVFQLGGNNKTLPGIYTAVVSFNNGCSVTVGN